MTLNTLALVHSGVGFGTLAVARGGWIALVELPAAPSGTVVFRLRPSEIDHDASFVVAFVVRSAPASGVAEPAVVYESIEPKRVSGLGGASALTSDVDATLVHNIEMQVVLRLKKG